MALIGTFDSLHAREDCGRRQPSPQACASFAAVPRSMQDSTHCKNSQTEVAPAALTTAQTATPHPFPAVLQNSSCQATHQQKC